MSTRRTKMATVAWTMIAAALLIGCGEKPEALVGSAKEYLAKNNRNEAVIQLKNALQINPDFAEARYLLGKIELEAGDLDAAERDLRRAQELKFSEDLVTPPLARLLITRGELKKAVDQFSNVNLTTPEARAELAVALAPAQAAMGNIDAARAGYAAALKAVPGYAPAMLGEAMLKAATGDLAGAMATVDAALAASPSLSEAWLLKGDLSASMKQPDNAIAAYRKALELRGDTVTAHTKLVMLLLEQGKTQEATTQFEAMKKAAPKNPQTLYLQALLAFKEKNFAAAREAIQLQLRSAPDNVPGLVLAGSIDLQLDSYAQAEASLKKALQLAPKHRQARVMLVSTYLQSRESAKALDALKPLLEDGEPGPEILALAGEVYMRNGKSKDAERVLAKATALDPKDTTKRTALALAHVSSGEKDRGLKELEDAAAADPGIRADLVLIGANIREKKWDAAMKAIAALEKKQANKALPHNLRGAVYVAKGDISAARQSYERALAVDPADLVAAASLARLDVAAKNPEAAQKRFDAVLAKDPKNVRAYLAMAELRRLSGGSADEVGALLGKAVAADPTSVPARLAVVNQYLANKEPKKAVEAAQNALAAMPDRPELLEAAGVAQMAAGDTNQAVATFGKLALARPGDPEPYIRMASAQMRANETDNAVASLRKALALRPDMVGIHRAMVKISLDAGRENDALAMAREVQTQRPNESVGYLLEGDIYASKKTWDKAIAAYRNGLRSVGSTDLATRVDASLRVDGKASEADTFSTAWVRDHPKDGVYRAYLAQVALDKKDYARAAAHYKALLESQPDNAVVLNNLAFVAGKLKDPKAIEYAEKAYKTAPNNAAVLDTLGGLLVERGDVKRGLQMIQTAAALAPRSADIHLNLARALIKDGQKPAAKKELEKLALLGDKFSGQSEVTKLMQGL